MAPPDDKSSSDNNAAAAAAATSTTSTTTKSDLEDVVDMSIFCQILEMDEPGDREFSTSIVSGYFEQAAETLESMYKALDEEDLVTLASLSHFLKGSSATLGFNNVRDGCEKIQRYGNNENVDGSAQPDSSLSLSRIKETLGKVETDNKDVERILKKYFEEEDSKQKSSEA